MTDRASINNSQSPDWKGWKSLEPSSIDSNQYDTIQRSNAIFAAISHSGAFVTTSAESLGAAVHSFWSTSNVPAFQLTIKENSKYTMTLYDTLSRAVDHLSQLDEDEEYYIDKDSAETGHGLLRILEQFNVSPPKIFSHGGDSLVFKWEGDASSRYITTSSAMARLREYADSTPGVVCTSKFDLRSPEQVFNLMTMLGGKQWKAALPEKY